MVRLIGRRELAIAPEGSRLLGGDQLQVRVAAGVGRTKLCCNDSETAVDVLAPPSKARDGDGDSHLRRVELFAQIFDQVDEVGLILSQERTTFGRS